jgi:lantibiotic leader peptide-processing serine protease
MKFTAKLLVAFLLPLALVDCASVRGSSRVLQDLPGTTQPAGTYLINLSGGCDEASFRNNGNGKVTLFHPGSGIAVMEGLDTPEKVAAVAGLPCVSSMDLDEAFFFDDTLGLAETSSDEVQSPNSPESAQFFSRQWNMRQINAPAAWNAGKLGSDAVTVAILDTGVDYLHVDLAGLVDLDKSASFCPWENPYIDASFPGRHPVTDLHYHGTHVANTVVSNGWGVAGVTSKTKIIGVKVCSAFGGCPFSSIVAGLLHAVDMGADVVNMSLGGAFTKAGNGGYNGYINQLFNYVQRHQVVIVVSAGNSATDLDHNGNAYANFCNTPSTICVSATDILDQPTSYTNYGNSAVDVAAPGGDSKGYVLAACSSSTLIPQLAACRSANRNRIVGLAGTSMASPHVAGLAALLVAEGKNPAQVKAAIRQGAVDLGATGNDPYFGKGRIDVAATVL